MSFLQRYTFWLSHRTRGSVILQLLQPRVHSWLDVSVLGWPPGLQAHELLSGHTEVLFQYLILFLQHAHFLLELLHHFLHLQVSHPECWIVSIHYQLFQTFPVIHHLHQLCAQPGGWGRGERLNSKNGLKPNFTLLVQHHNHQPWDLIICGIINWAIKSHLV